MKNHQPIPKMKSGLRTCHPNIWPNKKLSPKKRKRKRRKKSLVRKKKRKRKLITRNKTMMMKMIPIATTMIPKLHQKILIRSKPSKQKQLSRQRKTSRRLKLRNTEHYLLTCDQFNIFKCTSAATINNKWQFKMIFIYFINL